MIWPRKHKRRTPSQAFTRSKKIYHIWTSLKFCRTVHWKAFMFFFSSPEHKVLRVSYCDRSLSVVRRAWSVNFFTWTSSPLKPLIGFWPNFTGMIPGWSPTKVVQIVPVGCISRSQGKKKGFSKILFETTRHRSFIFDV